MSTVILRLDMYTKKLSKFLFTLRTFIVMTLRRGLLESNLSPVDRCNELGSVISSHGIGSDDSMCKSISSLLNFEINIEYYFDL